MLLGLLSMGQGLSAAVAQAPRAHVQSGVLLNQSRALPAFADRCLARLPPNQATSAPLHRLTEPVRHRQTVKWMGP